MMARRKGLFVIALGLLVLLWSCASEAPPSPVLEEATPSVTVTPTPIPPSEEEELIRLIGSDWSTNFDKHSVPYSEIIWGGVPRDGIPPIYEPRFESVAQADIWLNDVEPVTVFELEGKVRAYPLRILIWHEIVNDEVAGIPVAITYCPLCNTAHVFDRRLDSDIHIFGVSGLLRYSDLIMWDHQTESLWQQATGEAIVGDLTGRMLDFLPSAIVSWKEYKTSFPQGEVLSQDTGFQRPYGVNPYIGYDTSLPFLFSGEPDLRLPAMERVIGVLLSGDPVAYPFSTLAQAGVVNDRVRDRKIVIFYSSGTVSPLDESSIERSREVGAAAVFDPTLKGEALTFTRQDGQIVDRETGSTWNIFGVATNGSLQGQALKPVVHGTHFWFAWAAFNPETRIYQDSQ